MNRPLAAVLVAVTVIGLASCASGSKPDPADVAAARGCQAMVKLTADAAAHRDTSADGQAVVTQATAMVQGTAEAHANGSAEPKWAKLGSDLVQFAADINSGASGATLNDDASPILTECGSIPAAAKRAGGFVH